MGLRKATADRFNEEVREHCLQALGGRVDAPFADERVVVDTVAGPLHVWPATRYWRRRNRPGLYTVFCRFEDPDRAKAALGGKLGRDLNPYSGKYNFHEDGRDDDLPVVLASFARHLEKAGLVDIHDKLRVAALRTETLAGLGAAHSERLRRLSGEMLRALERLQRGSATMRDLRVHDATMQALVLLGAVTQRTSLDGERAVYALAKVVPDDFR